MAGVHKFSGSFSHSGSTAQFISGVSSSGVVTGAFIGNGSLLTNLQFGTSQINLFFGSESLGTGVYEYLLLAMSTASKETVTAGATVIINPELLE